MSANMDIDVGTDASGENAIDELVDYFNARDFEALAELLAPDVTSDFLDLAGRAGITENLAELAIRNPGLVLTRGELGTEPVAVAWTPGEVHDYRMLGFLTFTFSEEAEALIDHLQYDDRPEDADELLAEEPDPDDMAEGGEWQEWEAGEDPAGP